MNTSLKFCTSVLLAALFAVNAAQAANGDPKAGKKKSEACQGCHGTQGISSLPNSPHLAGQYPQYIERQIADYRNAKRSDPAMSAIAASISDPQDLKDIAAYYASRKPAAGKPGDNKTVRAEGKAIFDKGIEKTGVYACAVCHGKAGRGKDPRNNLFPVIAGQPKDYLVKQMNDYRSGERRNDPAGMMGDIAKKMTDAEINAVSEYTSGM